MTWDFFDRKICLTTQHQEWLKAEEEFARVGLLVEKFQSIPDIGPHQSFSRSVRSILIEFYESKANTLLHLEDDCTFKSLEHVSIALSELPSEWDMVYLGANLICGDGEPVRYSDHLFRVNSAWTTHAVGYNRKAIPFILENQPGFSERMYDNWLSEQLKSMQAFIIAPMVAYQRPRISSIWQRFDDYTNIFEESNAKLR